MYYFIRVFEVDSTSTECGFRGVSVNRKLIFENVVDVESKDDVKNIIFDKFGKIPLRKSNKLVDGDLYGYIAESSEYWYNYHNKEYSYKCDECGKDVKIIGEKNLYGLRSKYGSCCSPECYDIFNKKMRKEELKNSPWIRDNDHLCIPKDNDRHLAGYIYRITNKIETKSYIGKTVKPPLFRWWQHLKMDPHKFNRVNLTDLLFEVLEIVTYNEKLECDSKYKNAEEKLSCREMFYIKHYDVLNDEKGYNKMFEKSKTLDDFQLSLTLEEPIDKK